MKDLLSGVHRSEEGHWAPSIASMVAGAGAILLAIGAANDSGAIAIAGGIIVAVGFVGYDTVRHSAIDKEFFRRTDKPRD